MKSAIFVSVSSSFRLKNQELISEILGQQFSIQDTKAQILNTYLKIAVKEGSTSLSLTRLADELKISKQLVRYHLPDLDRAALELFKITAQVGARFTQERLSRISDPGDKFYAWIEATFDWVVAYPDFAKFLLFMYHRASVDAEVKDLHARIVSTGRARLHDILSRYPKKKIQKNLENLTRTLHQLITSSLIEMLSLDDLKSHARYRKEFIESAQYILEL